jgi:hypothetical protein
MKINLTSKIKLLFVTLLMSTSCNDVSIFGRMNVSECEDNCKKIGAQVWIYSLAGHTCECWGKVND